MPLVKGRGDRVRAPKEYFQWEYITLTDFNGSFATAASFSWLWFMAIVSVAVYAADTFTAVQLLAFGHWSSQINPAIPISTSKWIFVACILFSWILFFFEFLRAIRVIRRGNVAESYLDPLAVTLQSLRPDQNWSGWRRFLVFAELTKSRKGADYAALFAYFQFKGSVRILAAEGPRQAVNALTLYSVLQANIIPIGQNAPSDGHTAIVQFFYNIKLLADEHLIQALILLSMLFTFIVWAISLLSFIIALLMFLVFLLHYIPSEDGNLSRYCRRKVDNRLGRIADEMFKRALMEQDGVRRKHQQSLAEKSSKGSMNGTRRAQGRPQVPEKDAAVLGIVRPALNSTSTDRSALAKAPRRHGQPELLSPQDPSLPNLGEIKTPNITMQRADSQSTHHSGHSFDSDELISNVAVMGSSVVAYDPTQSSSGYASFNNNQNQSHNVHFWPDLEGDGVSYPGDDFAAPAPPSYAQSTSDLSDRVQPPIPVARKPSASQYTYSYTPQDVEMSDLPWPQGRGPPVSTFSTGLPTAPNMHVQYPPRTQQYPTRNYSTSQYEAPRATTPSQPQSRQNYTYPNNSYIASNYHPTPPPQCAYMYEPSSGTSVPVLQNPPPRRNMTMPVKEPERYPAPRRVGSEPTRMNSYATSDAASPRQQRQYPQEPFPQRSMPSMQQARQPQRNDTTPVSVTVNVTERISPPRRVGTEPIQTRGAALPSPHRDGSSRRLSMSKSAPSMQYNQQPQRNNTLPTNGTERFPPSRRVRTDVEQPLQNAGYNAGRAGHDQGYGRRKSRDDMNRNDARYGYETRTTYRYD